MKIKKHLRELVKKSVCESFNKTGKLNSTAVEKLTKAFRSLPSYEAIPALSEYLNGIKRIISQSTLTIETSLSLTKTDTQKITRLLEKHYQISQTQTQINPDLLGGIRIKIGDLVVDDSLNSKIERIGVVIHG